MPFSSIRNGYSFVPCVLPRYLTMRRRRVDTCSLHAVVEQDDAVGDVLLEPLARELALAALAGDDRGDALVLQPAKQAAQLRAQERLVGEAAEEGLERVEHHALGADRVDGKPEPQEQALEVVLAGFLDLACARCGRGRRRSCPRRSSSRGRSRASARSATRSSCVSSKAMNTPGSSNSSAPRSRNSMASSVLPQPAAPQTRVGRPRGRPPNVISSRPAIPVGAFANAPRGVLAREGIASGFPTLPISVMIFPTDSRRVGLQRKTSNVGTDDVFQSR